MADVYEEGSELTKKKGFRWSSEMIGNLVTCLMAYKARIEYQALDFDGDRPAQYKDIVMMMFFELFLLTSELAYIF